MLVAGIVAEYNPFHSGHAWQIAETRRRGATHVAAVMSGCYVQRGEPALWDKWTRTRAALLGGVDLVVELPLPYAIATAQRFSGGAISLLYALGMDVLSFGCACKDTQLALGVAAVTSPEVQARTRELMKSEGVSYAPARQRAVRELFGEETAGLLTDPNNILAIEYLAALDRLDFPIDILAVQRRGAAHDSREGGEHVSASTLRELTLAGRLREGAEYLPGDSAVMLERAFQAGECFSPEQLERPMLAALRRLTREDIAGLPDISEGLENRIYTALRTAESIPALLDAIKTKRYSRARLRRILLCGFLGVSAELSAGPPPYLRVLGMNDRGREILAAAKRERLLPISQSLLRLSQLGERERRFAALEATADDLYGTVTQKIQPCGRDYTNSIIKI